jgi:hypothetical protein
MNHRKSFSFIQEKVHYGKLIKRNFLAKEFLCVPVILQRKIRYPIKLQ